MSGYEEKGLLTTTNTRAELNDIFDPVIQSALNDRTTLYGLLKKEANIGGDYVRWRMRTGRNDSATSYLEDGAITKGNATRIKCSTPIKLLKVGVEVSGLMMAASQGRTGIGDIYAEELKDATKDFLVEVNSQLFGDGTGNGGADLFGLKNTIDTTGNLYGHTGEAALIGNVTDVGGADISISYLREMIRKSEMAGANKNDLLFVTSYKQRDLILDLIQNMQRVIPTSARVGFEGLPTVDGIPIHADAQCDDDYVYLIDMSVTMLKVTTPPTYEELSKTKDARSGFIKMYAEFICKAPTHLCKYYGFA